MIGPAGCGFDFDYILYRANACFEQRWQSIISGALGRKQNVCVWSGYCSAGGAFGHECCCDSKAISANLGDELPVLEEMKLIENLKALLENESH